MSLLHLFTSFRSLERWRDQIKSLLRNLKVKRMKEKSPAVAQPATPIVPFRREECMISSESSTLPKKRIEENITQIIKEQQFLLYTWEDSKMEKTARKSNTYHTSSKLNFFFFKKNGYHQFIITIVSSICKIILIFFLKKIYRCKVALTMKYMIYHFERTATRPRKDPHEKSMIDYGKGSTSQKKFDIECASKRDN